MRQVCLPVTGKLFGRLAALILAVPLTGCHWLSGNPDAVLNHGVFWRETVLSPPVRQTLRIWVRVGSADPSAGRVPVLATRVRQALMQHGWEVVEDRNRASVLLDLDIRYWGVNPIRDQAKSTYAKVLVGQRPERIGAKETPARGRFSSRSFLTPIIGTISAYTANVVEYNLIVDIHLQQNDLEEKRTLVVWVRKIDLEEQEAANEISKRVLEALAEVFQ